MKIFLNLIFFIVVLTTFNNSVVAKNSNTVDSATFNRWMTELSNWGRWGKDDELGSINLITPKKRIEAAKLVEKGISISLARELRNVSTRTVATDDFKHEVVLTGLDPSTDASSDRYTIAFHGSTISHLDALCHIFNKGKMYNDFSQKLVTETGCQKLSVDVFSDGIFTRGVLMDFANLKGIPSLEPGTAIMSSDLDDWEKKTGVKVRSGDALLIRTGRWSPSHTKENTFGAWSGLHASAAKWLHDRDISILGTDANAEVYLQNTLSGEGGAWRPPLTDVEGEWFPVHKLLMVAMGTQIMDNLDLDGLTAEAKRQGRWDFLFTFAPLSVPGGTGSPINPIATF